MSLQKIRYQSLDVFRGLDIALMIIVNTPGTWSKIYAPLKHAQWNGFTLTDLVFPTFLFVVGNAMSFSIRKFDRLSNTAILSSIFRRTFLIFAIGFLLNWFPYFQDGEFIGISDVRVFGVLQRIALCYFMASIIIHYCKVKWSLILSAAILVLYNVVMECFGDFSLENNAVIKLDSLFLNSSQLYAENGVPFDPEGLLSTFPAVVNVIFGYLFGMLLQKKGQNHNTLTSFFVWGSLIIFLGFTWDLIFLFNKKIWSSSYVLLTIGIDIFMLSILVYLIDIKKFTKGMFIFESFGKNPLFIYIFSGVFAVTLQLISFGEGNNLYGLIATDFLMNTFGDYLGSLLFALWFTSVCWLLGYILEKKKIYIKV